MDTKCLSGSGSIVVKSGIYTSYIATGYAVPRDGTFSGYPVDNSYSRYGVPMDIQ